VTNLDFLVIFTAVKLGKNALNSSLQVFCRVDVSIIVKEGMVSLFVNKTLERVVASKLYKDRKKSLNYELFPTRLCPFITIMWLLIPLNHSQ
jgi:hypothetical protein